MTFKTRELTVDLINEVSTNEIRFSQGDKNSAKLLLNITNEGQELDLSQATAVRITFEKQDKTIVFQQDCQPINAMKGKYQIVLKTQTLAVIGNVYGQVTIFEDDDREIDSQMFVFTVKRSLSGDDAIESTNEFTIIQKAIEAGEKLEGVDIPALIASKETAEQAKVAAEQNATQIGILSELDWFPKNIVKAIDDLRTWLDQRSINVRQPPYNAKGDGIADDTAAIQAALTYIKTNGYGTVWFPNGTYNISGKLRVYGNTKILMAKGTVLKRTAGGVLFSNGDDNENYNSYNGNSNIEFEGGTIDMQGSTVPNMGSAISIGHANGFTAKNMIIKDVVQAHGFDICGVNNVLIDNVRFEGFFDPDNSRGYSEAMQIDLMKMLDSFSTFGLYDQTPTINVNIRNCYVGNSSTVGAKKWNRAVGSHSSTHDVFFKNIKITGNTFNTNDYAISAIKFDDVIITNNILEECVGGIRLMLPPIGDDTKDANGVQSNVIQSDRRYIIKGNIIKNTGTSHAVQVYGREPARIDVVSIEGNLIDNTGAGSKGINVTAANKVIVSNNIIKNSTGVAISVDYCNDVVASVNVISDSNDSGIYFTFSKDFKIINNIITRSGSNGISIKDCQLFEIEGNKVVDASMKSHNTSPAIYLFTNVKEGSISGNRVYSTNPSLMPNHGIRLTNTCSKMLRYNNFIKGSGATADVLDNSITPYTVADLS
ncbi:TPA: BppU family phage baseplate upper protein [Bacillus luti]|nr:BppU family phage baseplate upper protein [Bacillus luti]